MILPEEVQLASRDSSATHRSRCDEFDPPTRVVVVAQVGSWIQELVGSYWSNATKTAFFTGRNSTLLG